jgi:beta-galactosidase
MSERAPYLVAFEQCGLELQAPHFVTRKKRRIESVDVDVATLAADSLRFVGWAEDELIAIFPELDRDATYEIEATFLCERRVRRVVAITAGGIEVQRPVELGRATAMVVQAAVPIAAYADGILDIRVVRVEGPDVVLSELRLFSSRPPAPTITVIGDSRAGLIGTVGAADSTGVANATVQLTGEVEPLTVRTDDAGLFRVPLDRLPLARHGTVTLATGDGPTAARVAVDTRQIARGLRELPPTGDRLNLNGSWGFQGGPYRGDGVAGVDPAETRVPGHIIFDGLVPDDGMGTFLRSFDLPAAWRGRLVFLRCDAAYGRAEVRINGSLAGVHGSGATSFDVDLTAFVRPGRNDLAMTLTEFTPHAVLDDMSWYAHMSLLGIWRDVCLFSTPPVHLAHLAIEADWDATAGTASLDLGLHVVNAGERESGYDLEITVRDGDRIVHRSRRTGTVAAADDSRESIASGPLAVEPWSAETPRLHDLEVVLRAGQDRTDATQIVRRRIGFRRVETRGNQLLVNGAPIRVRGVNRHDSRILAGRALSHDDMREDIVNLRETNVNVIRTSHYPPSPHLLDVCDELGMFVFEQPPICFAGGFDDHHWTRTNEAAPLIPIVLEVTAETVARDAGHPSVIVWDLGNESRWGPAFDAQLALVREMDPHRPTIFSFDLNELGPENQLVGKPDADRPDLRSYHYPGWDRTWQEDLDWLGAYDQPTVLDEYAPVFAPCVRGPGEGYGLSIDPGIRDYWGAGYQPFVAAALHDRGVIGGLVWGGFGEVFAIPLDLTIGEGPWTHLPVTDYVRTHDHYPSEPGVFRRGDGDWGIFDAWNRPRPERWHVHQMYSPIAWTSATFDGTGERLEVVVTNRFSHRSLAGLGIAVDGGHLDGTPGLSARPGDVDRLVVARDDGTACVRVELWHEEGWLVDAHEWPWPNAGPSVAEVLREGAVDLELDRSVPGELAVVGGGRRWLRRWPELHVLDVDRPHVPVPGPSTDGGRATATGSGSVRAPFASRDWDGAINVRIDGRTLVVEYDATYLGGGPFNAREIGLTIHPAAALTELWWRRIGEWTTYPEDHVGRRAGRAPAAPGSNGTLRPAATWGQDATGAGSNDYRSTKRSILVAGATDGESSLSILSDGSQHVRAELVDGLPVLHVSDWFGGVRTVEGNHPIWSAYFGVGRPVAPGSRLHGRIVLVAGAMPPVR